MQIYIATYFAISLIYMMIVEAEVETQNILLLFAFIAKERYRYNRITNIIRDAHTENRAHTFYI